MPGETTRPILDRVKAALLDILRPDIEGVAFLDLFAGSGGVGIEALSQGAKSCVFVDCELKAILTIRENLKATELTDQSEVRKTDAFLYLRKSDRVFDLIFIAPPQYKGLWLEALKTVAERPHLLNDDGGVIVQIDPKEYEEVELESLKERRQKRYGNTLLVFYGRGEVG